MQWISLSRNLIINASERFSETLSVSSLCSSGKKIGRACFAISNLRPIFIYKISDANKMRHCKATGILIAAYGLKLEHMMPSLWRQIDASHRQMIRADLGNTWPETISTTELTQRSRLIHFSRSIRNRRLNLVNPVVRMQSRRHAPLGTLLTNVPSNWHHWQGHGRTSTLQYYVADDLWSINCDETSISEMTNSCLINLFDTLDWIVCISV